MRAITQTKHERELFDLGWDAFSIRFGPFENWPRFAKMGFNAAKQKRVSKKKADKYKRKWLQISLSALSRDIPISDKLTPNYLRTIDTGVCPVTYNKLTYGTNELTDWSVDRVVNSIGYVPGNVIILSTKANLAKSNLNEAEIREIVESRQSRDGLSPEEWERMAHLLIPFFTAVESDTMQTILAGGRPVPGMPLGPAGALQSLLSMLAEERDGRKRFATIRSRHLKNRHRKDLTRIWRDLEKWAERGGDAYKFWAVASYRQRFENVAATMTPEKMVRIVETQQDLFGSGHATREDFADAKRL